MTKKKETPMTSPNVTQLAELASRASRSMVAVIDALAGRGAYKGEELFAIGQLRDQSAQLSQLAEAVQSEIASDATKE